MNRKIVLWVEAIAFLLAVLLIVMGILIGFQIYSYLDGITEYDGNIVLVGQMRWAAIYSIVSGIMVVVGSVILFYLVLKQFHHDLLLHM